MALPDHDDVTTMSDEELLAYYKYHDHQQIMKDGGQLVRKILLNC